MAKRKVVEVKFWLEPSDPTHESGMTSGERTMLTDVIYYDIDGWHLEANLIEVDE
jgi:hypothetical protein